MNVEQRLAAIRDVIQRDVGNRGLARDPADNLLTACAGDFAAACRSLAETAEAAVAVVTGFHIPHATPPCGETDGPLGAVFLARALAAGGIKVVLATDAFCTHPLEVGLAVCGLRKVVPLVTLPSAEAAGAMSASEYWDHFAERAGPLTHLVALERVGPSHTPQSVQAQSGNPAGVVEQFLHEAPPDHHDRCHTMRGHDITASMSPAQRLFEFIAPEGLSPVSVGVGDGGNEIGMGRVPWDTIRRNIPNGGLVACRVPTDYLIVAGVSNWGAYALGAGVTLLRKLAPPPDLFDVERERELLRVMVEEGPLVDGVTGQPTVSVDGLAFEEYAAPLREIGRLVRD